LLAIANKILDLSIALFSCDPFVASGEFQRQLSLPVPHPIDCICSVFTSQGAEVICAKPPLEFCQPFAGHVATGDLPIDFEKFVECCFNIFIVVHAGLMVERDRIVNNELSQRDVPSHNLIRPAAGSSNLLEDGRQEERIRL
jgi:hypothetical protein